jgi:carbon monoxide dehydrogenase subunit G
MDVAGNQKIKTSRQHVFHALLNPEILKNSIPGCESAEFVDSQMGRQLKLIISVNVPGVKGRHEVSLRTGEVVQPSRIVFIAEPSSSRGSVKAICTVDLTDEPAGMNLNYTAHAELEGIIAAIPEIVLNGVVKMSLSHFFKNFEKQVSQVLT